MPASRQRSRSPFSACAVTPMIGTCPPASASISRIARVASNPLISRHGDIHEDHAAASSPGTHPPPACHWTRSRRRASVSLSIWREDELVHLVVLGDEDVEAGCRPRPPCRRRPAALRRRAVASGHPRPHLRRDAGRRRRAASLDGGDQRLQQQRGAGRLEQLRVDGQARCWALASDWSTEVSMTIGVWEMPSMPRMTRATSAPFMPGIW